MNIQIEQAKVEDVEEIFDMKLQSWITTYAKGDVTEDDIRIGVEAGRTKQLQNFKSMITDKRSGDSDFPIGIVVARVDGKIVGIVTPMVFDGQNRVGSLYILKEYEGKGIGHLLMQRVLDAFEGKDIYLHVQTENERAIKFYEKYGFTKNQDLPLEYFDTEKTKELHQIEMVRKAS
jgi:ribosomal protein S18 acetylase RimI-like enzyme